MLLIVCRADATPKPDAPDREEEFDEEFTCKNSSFCLYPVKMTGEEYVSGHICARRPVGRKFLMLAVRYDVVVHVRYTS